MLKFVLLQLQIENIILTVPQSTCIKILRNVGVLYKLFFLLMASSTSYGSVLLEEYKGGEGEGRW